MSNDKQLTEEQVHYREVYAAVALAARQLEIAQAKLTAHHNQMLVDLSVRSGDSIDWWGGGEVKRKADCKGPPEVN